VQNEVLCHTFESVAYEGDKIK